LGRQSLPKVSIPIDGCEMPVLAGVGRILTAQNAFITGLTSECNCRYLEDLPGATPWSSGVIPPRSYRGTVVARQIAGKRKRPVAGR